MSLPRDERRGGFNVMSTLEALHEVFIRSETGMEVRVRPRDEPVNSSVDCCATWVRFDWYRRPRVPACLYTWVVFAVCNRDTVERSEGERLTVARGAGLSSRGGRKACPYATRRCGAVALAHEDDLGIIGMNRCSG